MEFRKKFSDQNITAESCPGRILRYYLNRSIIGDNLIINVGCAVAAIFSPNFSPNNTQTSTADRCLLLVQRKGNDGNGLVIEIIECIEGKA